VTRHRVARVIGILEPGGAQLSAFRLTNALRRLGFDTRFLAGDASAEGLQLALQHGIEVEAFTAGAGLQWEPSPEFAAWLEPRLRGADLVHGHMFGAWWAAAQVLAPDVPLVASEHNVLNWPGAHHARELRDALPRVDLFFAHGPATTAYVKALGMPPERVLPGTSAIAGFASQPHPWLPAPRIVQTARLAPDKAPDVLVEALGLIGRPPPSFIVGTGRMLAALRRRVRELGLEDVVHFPGWQSEPGRWVAGASVFPVSSREEAWSQSAVLAMALGVPVVGTAVEGLPITLADGRGILVPPEDPEALARAIEDVLSGRRRPDLEAARAYAEQFTPARVAGAYARRYRALLAGAPPAEPALTVEPPEEDLAPAAEPRR
jgi:glycosyltransferase involved in cell wall biosynthesis